MKDEALLASVREKPCEVCGRTPVDAAHIKTQGSGGGDFPWNVLPLCRRHHQIQHHIGWMDMVKEHPKLLETLKKMGWSFQFIGDIPKLRREEAIEEA